MALSLKATYKSQSKHPITVNPWCNPITTEKFSESSPIVLTWALAPSYMSLISVGMPLACRHLHKASLETVINLFNVNEHLRHVKVSRSPPIPLHRSPSWKKKMK